MDFYLTQADYDAADKAFDTYTTRAVNDDVAGWLRQAQCWMIIATAATIRQRLHKDTPTGIDRDTAQTILNRADDLTGNGRTAMTGNTY
jgi:hypothetical protein